jgi:nucleoside-diphosphate-sugar epimerase
MLDALKPDVVHVLTPPATHAALCVEALDADAHVYVEKPMALTEVDCDLMIDAAKRNGRELCVGHSLVYDPLLAQAFQAIERGHIGEIVHASAVFCFDPKRIPDYNSKAWYRRLGGGFVEDLATHPASVLLRVIGKPKSLASASHDLADGTASGISALIEGERATGTLLVSLAGRPEDVSLEVRGTRGFVSVNFSTMVVTVQRDRKLPKKLVHGFRNVFAARDLAVQTVVNTARYLAKRMDTTKGVHTLIGAFYAALAERRSAPVAPEEGREIVHLMRRLWPDRTGFDQPARFVLSNADVSEAAEAPTISSRMRSALVTGASGFIGAHLVHTLASRGIRVRALARDPKRAQRLAAPNVEVVIGDFADPAVIEGLAEHTDTIFHLASVMTGSRDEFERVDLAGTRNLIAEAKRARVERFVFTSTMGAYALAGLPDGAVVTEEMIDAPDRVGNYARAKLLIEQMLMTEHNLGHFDAVVLRPGLVFGPGASPFLEHLPHLGSLRGNRYVVFGDANVRLQLTYVENTVEALWLAATVEAAAGQTFTIIDDDLPTQREFVSTLAALTGRPLRVSTIPRVAAHAIGAGVEALFAALGRKPPTTRRLLLGKTAKISFDTTRAKQVLGWEPRIGWQEGLERNVASASRRTPAANDAT